MYLTGDELHELTKKKRPTAQARELDQMGIPYRTRTDGSLAVLAIHAETFEGEAAQSGDRLPPEPVVLP